MSLFSNLIEAVVNEIKYKEFKTKQASITRLFPTFYQRVRDVASHGGIAPRLAVQTPDTWMFNVASTSKDGGDYAVWFHFTNIPEMLEKWVPVRELWSRDQKTINYQKLAQEVFNEVDMQSDCDCAADTYWGSEYIKTQKKAQYGQQQNIPPKVRNPKQYGILCKHAHLVWQQLPMWTGTFAKHLKDMWNDEIQTIVKRELDAAKPKETPKVEKPVAKPLKGKKSIPGEEADAKSQEPIPGEEPEGTPDEL